MTVVDVVDIGFRVLTSPKETCNTSSTAALCRKAVVGPTASYEVHAR
jgi:hypothetical protein